MKTVYVTLKNLRNGEYVSYAKACLRIIDRNDPDMLGLREHFDALTANVTAVEEVFRQDRTSELTETITELDALRGKFLVSIATVVRGYLGHYDEAKVAMAERLHHCIAVYGTPSLITVQPLQQELATIDNLVDDLQHDPDLAAAVAALHLTEWVNRLQQANNNLRMAYDERIQERAALPPDTIKDLRQEGHELFYQTRDRLAALALVADYAPPYDTVINEVNDLSDRFNDVLARRREGGWASEEAG